MDAAELAHSCLHELKVFRDEHRRHADVRNGASLVYLAYREGSYSNRLALIELDRQTQA